MKERFLIIISTAFIIGLVWYVSINKNIVVFLPMLMLMGYFNINNSFSIDKRYIFVVFMFVLIFLFWGILNITLHDKYDYVTSIRFVRAFIFGFIVLSFIFLFYGNRKQLLVKSIEYALWIILILWFIQFIVYYTLGEYIDLLEPIAGSERVQRYQAYWIKDSLPIDLIRPTSIFIEPGTYAVNTLPLMMLSYIVRQRLTKLHVLTLFSYFASISLFAITVASLFILVTQLSTLKFKFSKKNIFLLIFFTLLAFVIMEYLYYRFVVQGGTDQVAYREGVVTYWLSQDSLGFLLGQGAAQMEVKRVMVEDASFMFMLVFEYGIFSLPYFLLMLFISWGLPIAFFLILLLTKLNYLLYTVWLYIAGLTILRDYRINKE
ncbi:MAG TPA: hypothetical protein ENK66_08090 [Arcobacter sp.]|nr:hypothetical protein [Arcobacter sp.]